MQLDLETDVGVAIVRTGFRLRRALQDAFRETGAEVTVAEFGVLGLLSVEDGRRIGEVADFMFLDRTTVTRHVDRLDAKGLVARRPDPEDRRAVRLVLTRAGRRLLRRLLPIRQALLGRATTGLSSKRQDELRRSLRHMQSNLDRPEEDAR